MAVRIKHNVAGYKALRAAPGVVADLERRANAVKETAGDGFEMSSRQGAARPQGRWRTSVVTATPKAMRKNQRENTLLRALEAGRG